MKLVYNRETQTITALFDDGTVAVSYECRDDFWAGENDEGQGCMGEPAAGGFTNQRFGFRMPAARNKN